LADYGGIQVHVNVCCCTRIQVPWGMGVTAFLC
jgi:hypothetical protein